jgi:hypothetical protein
VGELDLERAMGESIAEGPATTQDEEVGESEWDKSAEEELAAVEKVVESLMVGKGKGKAVPARAKVYVEVDGPVSGLLKLSSICANTFAYSATDVSHGRRSRNASQTHTSNAARSVRLTRAGALGEESRGCRGRGSDH